MPFLSVIVVSVRVVKRLAWGVSCTAPVKRTSPLLATETHEVELGIMPEVSDTSLHLATSPLSFKVCTT